VYFAKVFLLVCFMMAVRWTLPRMRFDQVMMMGWQAVIPLALVVVVGTSAVVFLDLGDRLALPWGQTLPLIAMNVLIAGALLLLYPWLPRYQPNRRIRLYGSRFNPVPGEVISTTPTEPLALQDRPARIPVQTR
jgi:NADH-quinone oxidoreductase subunit H